MIKRTPAAALRARIVGGGLLLTLASAAISVLAASCKSGADTTPATNDPVLAASVDSIILNLDSAEVIIGDTVHLVAIPVDAAGRPVLGLQLVWTSTDPSIATVSTSGLVTALSFGLFEIDVAVAGATLNAGLDGGGTALRQQGAQSRWKGRSAPKINITPSSASIDLPGSKQFEYSLADIRGVEVQVLPLNIVWSSSDLTVATISKAGVATAVDKGTTFILAKLLNRFGVEVARRSVPLKVEICGGLLDVETWTGTLSTAYKVLPTFGDFKFDIDQSSNAAVTLVRGPRDVGTDSKWTIWDGVPTGTARIINKGYQLDPGPPPAFRLDETEDGSGPIQPLATVELTAIWNRTDGCKYSIRYEDRINFTHTDLGPGGSTVPVQFFTAAVADRFRAVPAKPAGGWQLKSPLDPTVIAALYPIAGTDPSDTGELGSLGLNQYYYPGPALAAAMLSFAPGNKFGTATFIYTLTAR